MTAISPSSDALKQQISSLLRDELVAVRDCLKQQFRNRSGFIQDVADHASRFRGKQIRPILTLLSARLNAQTAAATQQARLFAAVVEMIHAATLVHDDVIDDADIRRHVSTVHRRWNTETSVLFGDYLFSQAFTLAATSGDAEACRLIGHATNRTCEGELNQVAARLEHSRSERDYFRVIYGKTGHLFAVSCRLGARASGLPEKSQRLLSLFGARVGMAFQIADDVLDLTANAERTGKDSRNDLQNNRLTLPVLRALRLGNESERKQLLEFLEHSSEQPEATTQDCPAIQAGLDSASRSAERLAHRAIACLRHFPDGPERRTLAAIAMFAAGRPC